MAGIEADKARIDNALVPRLEQRSIVLVGLMGAGKSAVGRRLAARLGIAFDDSDTEIEASAGKTIAEIFTEHGEPYFREGERRVVARLLDHGPSVLATGGGAYMHPATREVMRERALTVWLKAELDVLLERVSRRNTRPLLWNGDPRATMARLMAERYPVYSQADITIESRHVPHEIIVDEIIAALRIRLLAEPHP